MVDKLPYKQGIGPHSLSCRYLQKNGLHISINNDILEGSVQKRYLIELILGPTQVFELYLRVIEVRTIFEQNVAIDFVKLGSNSATYFNTIDVIHISKSYNLLSLGVVYKRLLVPSTIILRSICLSLTALLYYTVSLPLPITIIAIPSFQLICY
jgi:hypothetical protein